MHVRSVSMPVESTFKGDRKRYQQPIGSSKIAMRAMSRDLQEGADVLLVKPCLFYGDIIRNFANASNVPIAALGVGSTRCSKDYGEATGCGKCVERISYWTFTCWCQCFDYLFHTEIVGMIPRW